MLGKVQSFRRIISSAIYFPLHYSQFQTNKVLDNLPPYFEFCNSFTEKQKELADNVLSSMTVYENFLSEQEEQTLLKEIDPYMKRLRYEFDHWDDAIHGYRETERLKWNEENTEIIEKVRKLAFPVNTSPLKFVHILDLDEKGYIKPHIDAVRFCGDTIAGLCLLTDSIMRLVHDKQKDFYVNIFLKRRSLYIMKGSARYDYTHEILKNDDSIFKGTNVLKKRRISVICRNEPDHDSKY